MQRTIDAVERPMHIRVNSAGIRGGTSGLGMGELIVRRSADETGRIVTRFTLLLFELLLLFDELEEAFERGRKEVGEGGGTTGAPDILNGTC